MTDTFDAQAYANALLTIAQSTGRFSAVIGHEAKNAPDDSGGPVCELWGMSAVPARESSGLASVSVVAEFQLRVMRNMLAEPADLIDVEILGAASTLANAIAGAFTLGGLARDVDIMGADSEGLRIQLGYLSIGGAAGQGGSRMFRVIDVLVPIVINDCWDLVA